MAEELVEVKVPQRRGPDRLVAADEGIREGVTAESLAGLPPAFAPDGTITAASSSPISDGAAAHDRPAPRRPSDSGRRRWRFMRTHGGAAADIPAAAAGRGHPVAFLGGADRIRDLDLIEINEAFAAVGVASAPPWG